MLSESSDSESSTTLYRKKQCKRIIVGQSNVKKICYSSTNEGDNSGPKFINRNNNLSNDKEYSDRKNKVEGMESSWKIDNGTSANKQDASNSVVTSNPLEQNKQGNKKNQKAVANIRIRITKMTEELKYILSKFKLKVEQLQLRCMQDETVMGQDGKSITCAYNSIIKKLQKELAVQQQISVAPYHRCDETAAQTESSSEIFSANYKRPKVTKISKPDVNINVNKQPVETNCTSAVEVEKNNNTKSKSDETLTGLLNRLKEINVIKKSSRTSVAGSISTVHSTPNLEVLNRAYKKIVERQDTSKQDSSRNGCVKEKGLLPNYDSDVNSTCSTVAIYPRRKGNVQINNYQGGLIPADANKDVSSTDISTSSISDVSSGNGEMSDEISLTNLYSSDSEGTIIISNNEIRKSKHRSEDRIPAKGKTVLTSPNSKNSGSKQRSEFVVPDINNLSTKYQSYRVAISNRANSVPECKPTEQNQYNTRVDEKLRMNCKVMIEKLRIRW
ncbi:uncharacterized protein LOC143370459 isoform X2 [Andrena cerasifolii]